MEDEYKHKGITEKIIKAFYAAYNGLGYGLLEKVCVNALVIELERLGLKVARSVTIQVFYAGQVIGEYVADLVVEDNVLLEIKAARALAPEHEAQLLNYLRATLYEVGLLLNFGPKPQVKRLAYSNSRKGPVTWKNP